MTPNPPSLKRHILAFFLQGACTLLVGSAFGYVALQLLCAAAGAFRSDGGTFANYSEPTKFFLIAPLVLAAIPAGLLGIKALVCIVPAARRFLIPEAAPQPGRDSWPADRTLIDVVVFSIPPLLALAACAAFFGK